MTDRWNQKGHLASCQYLGEEWFCAADCPHVLSAAKLARRDRRIAIGRRLAREVFRKRGNHSEVHLTELELAALLALAVGRGMVDRN